MNNRFVLMHGFWPVELLAAAGVVFWAVRSSRTKPGGSIARLLRHRDRIWFALLVLFVPAIPVRYLAVHFLMSQLQRGPGGHPQIVSLFFAVFNGAVYGMAACWLASPAKKEERFGYGLAFLVTGALLILSSALSTVMALGFHRSALTSTVPAVLAAIVVVAFLISRAFVKKLPVIQPVSVVPAQPPTTENIPSFTIIWLLVGLLPIPVLLAFAASSQVDHTVFPVVLIICAICNLCGGIGCLGRIKDAVVRAILGTCLGIFFFLLSWLIAAFEACSHSGGI